MDALPRGTALGMYELMWKIRLFELKAASGFREGRLPGFIHVSIGQEACSVGACAALNKDDFVTSTHRGHGHCLAKGADPNRMMAELYGKRTGYSRGKGGSMHIADVSAGVLGANGIVGQSLPLAVGAALTSQVLRQGRVTVAFFGEGASGTGAAHEAMNIAGLWRLPIVFFCEANEYAELSPYRSHVPIERLADRAAGYGFPGVTVDGNDVVAVYRAMVDAVGRARAGLGPTLVEGKTYRWHGHYEGDPQHYKPKGEAEERQKRDPIGMFEPYLLEVIGTPRTELDACEQRAREAVEGAVAFAEASEEPPIEEIGVDVYCEER